MKRISMSIICQSRRAATWARALPRTQKFLLTAVVIAVFVGAALGAVMLLRSQPTIETSTATLPAPVGPQKGTPTYGTVLPAHKSIQSLGGWTRVSPPNRDAVYAYLDTLGSAHLIVSEQPLPKEFAADPEAQTKQLATNYNATQKLAIGSTTAYLGTSTQGPQSVIFQRNGLLILIKASSSVDNAVWKEYINSLQ